jgi:hypothetical protein
MYGRMFAKLAKSHDEPAPTTTSAPQPMDTDAPAAPPAPEPMEADAEFPGGVSAETPVPEGVAAMAV